MKDKPFAPLLAPNDAIKLTDIPLPVIASYKLDGCLHRTSMIKTIDGEIAIENIVKNKLKTKVLTYNESKNVYEYNNITNWFDNGKSSPKEWVYLDIVNGSNICCTLNHKIFTNNGWKVANDLVENKDKIISNCLSKQRINIIAGTLLGDSFISIDKRGNGKSYRLIFQHTNKELFDYKVSILNLKGNCIEIKTGYGSNGYRFCSDALTKTDFPINSFYYTDKKNRNSGRKFLKYRTLFKYINIEALSIWIADDGSLAYNNKNKSTPILSLHTQSSSIEQVQEYVKLFKRKYNCTPTIIQDKRVKKNGYFLSFTTKDTLYILNLLKEKQCRGVEYKYYFHTEGYINQCSDSYIFVDFKKRKVSGTNHLQKYDLEVENNHNYIANGILVHNCRCIFKDGQMFSRALKQFPNVKLYERFEHLMRFSKENNIILDGELLAKSLTFNELSGITRQLDKELPDDLNFYCFDCIKAEDFNLDFQTRYLMTMLLPDMQYFEHLTQKTFHTCEEIEAYYTQALNWGCDGLILRNPKGIYKFGRATIKENIIYKLKPFQTFDSKVKYVIQATEVREGAEKKINELGRSVTSKKKDDRVLIDKAAAFLVDYNGFDLKVTIAATDPEKEAIWANKEKYIGKYIEFKGMLVGAKDLPRHPTLLRIREDRE